VPFIKDLSLLLGGSYIMECKLQGFLDDIDVLRHYVEEYYKQNMYDALKMEHLFDIILQNHPYLDLEYIGDFSSVASNNMENTPTLINEKCYDHQFYSTMSTSTFIVEQLIFGNIIKSMT
jgi:hypothetical protein